MKVEEDKSCLSVFLHSQAQIRKLWSSSILKVSYIALLLFEVICMDVMATQCSFPLCSTSLPKMITLKVH